jgi:hypothetical protein
MISCQVCWRTMRWHNGQIRRSLNPHPYKVFQDCDSKWEESVAHSILARRLFTPTKAVYMSADQPCPSHFSLAIRRRTIHVRIRRHSGTIRIPLRERIASVSGLRLIRPDHPEIVSIARRPPCSAENPESNDFLRALWQGAEGVISAG